MASLFSVALFKALNRSEIEVERGWGSASENYSSVMTRSIHPSLIYIPFVYIASICLLFVPPFVCPIDGWISYSIWQRPFVQMICLYLFYVLLSYGSDYLHIFIFLKLERKCKFLFILVDNNFKAPHGELERRLSETWPWMRCLKTVKQMSPLDISS